MAYLEDKIKRPSTDNSNPSIEDPNAHSLSPPPFQLKISDDMIHSSKDEESESINLNQASGSKEALPEDIKHGVESLSGQSMEGVSVNYNSQMPAQLKADAFAQGNQIHLAPGQEKHLPHEAWHIAQQKQGRVKANSQMGSNPINDDPTLEREADLMGDRALNGNAQEGGSKDVSGNASPDNGVNQLKIKMKDSGPAERTDGPFHKLKSEVNAVIGRNDVQEIREDVRRLELSIEHRENDQRGRDVQVGDTHEHRIGQEYQLLEKLKAALPKKKRKKKNKPKTNNDGWTTV